MTWLALPWFVFVTTGSATRMSVVVGAELIGLALLGIPGGAALRRLGAWRTLVLCDLLRAPLMLAIPALYWMGNDSFAPIVVFAFLLGALGAPFFAAQKVIVPELLGEDEAIVGRANALFQGATRITMLLGPVAGGILISIVSAPWALVVDGCTYLVSAALILLLVPRPATQPRAAEDVGARRGIRFLAREPLLRLWTPLFVLGDTAWTAFFVSVPVLVVTRFDADPRIAGWLLASFGVGAVLGNAIAYRVLLDRVPGLTLVGTCIVFQALPLWILTVHPDPWLAALSLGLSGLANGLVNPTIHSLMVLRVPTPLRPSVMTVNVMLFGLAQPLGVFGVGPVLDRFGPQPVLVAFAATQTLAMSLVAAASFAVRRREQATVQATRVAA
jgi:predicted MFS family arabinose efflux permease